MKSLHYFCENWVVFDLREMMRDNTHNERNQIKNIRTTTNDFNKQCV